MSVRPTSHAPAAAAPQAPTERKIAIRFDSVSKSYEILQQKPFFLREFWRLLLQRPSQTKQFEALHDISFAIEKGRSVGVIGHNGAGKSTLLSLVAETSYPTTGRVEVDGRVGPMLELGAGFHPDLTGYENIFLNAALLGLTRQEVEERLDDILDFAEIGDFIHAPIQTYSTGMKARLGFAVVAHVDADILLLDEVLAVGDAQFQQKCHRRIESFIDGSKTIFFVSHSLASVRELCEEVLWVEQGCLRAHGPVDDVAREYEQHFASDVLSGPSGT